MAEDVDTDEGLVRIRIRLEATGQADPSEDSVWAEPLGSDRYRVESCPFFAYGVSRDDLVRAAQEDGGPVLDEVLEKGGHRTLRLALAPAVELRSPPVQSLLKRLVDTGCTHELLRPRLVAIDVPPETDLAAVTGLLQEGAGAGTIEWEWADPRPS